MGRFKDRFINSNYAVMRHARPLTREDGQPLMARSITVCKEVAEELIEHVNNRPFKIFHSPLSRARLTAQVVRDTLMTKGVQVNGVEELEWLNEKSGHITNENISKVLDNDSFCLFISHMLEIERFLGEECGPACCTVISQEFIVTGNR